MKRAILVLVFGLFLCGVVYGDSTFTPIIIPSEIFIDPSIVPGEMRLPLRTYWYSEMRKRICLPDSVFLTMYPLGDVNCDGVRNPVDFFLMWRAVYYARPLPECRLP